VGILSWVVVGLLAGLLAKFVMPGNQGGGLIRTTILGVIGAFVGGFLARAFDIGDVSGFNLVSVLIAAGGALIVLFVAGKLAK